MAREYARFNVAIWQDPDWRALPAAAQHLYMLLWTHPLLTYCGVVDWRPGRIAALSDGLTRQDVEALSACLEARLFLVIDQDTEEALIRSWARFDGLMKQPRMAVSFANAYSAVASREVQGVIVHEARKLQALEPDLYGWEKPVVKELLAAASIDPRERTLPIDPFGSPLGPVSVPFGPNASEGLGPVWVAPTPTPTPTPTPLLPDVPTGGADADDDEEKPKPRRKPERPLPASWAPNAKHHEMANEKRIDIKAAVVAFRNHAETHDRRARDWDAAFRTWINKTNAPPAVAQRDDWMYR